MTKLDIDFVRAQFPALDNQPLSGRAFLENAGGSLPCIQVQDRMARFYRERKVQPDWPFAPSDTASAEMAEARARMAALLNVAEDEVSFGPSTTQNVYVLAHAFAEWLTPGDAIVVTDQDHEANAGAWRKLSNRGIEVREWQLDPDTGLLSLEDLAGHLDDRVRLVAFPHCSNIIGAINPVREITEMAQQAGAYVCIDGVSYAPHGLPDVGAIGADIYLFSTYKTYGPHQGVMVVRRSLGMELPNQGHWFNADALEKRFTPAGPDHAQIAACAGIVDYFDELHSHHFTNETPAHGRGEAVHALLREAECALVAPLLDYLSKSNRVRLIGPADPAERAPTISVLHERPAEELVRELAAEGVLSGGGDFYSVRPLKAMGIKPAHGVLRLSAVHYNTPAEIEKTLTVLDRVL